MPAGVFKNKEQTNLLLDRSIRDKAKPIFAELGLDFSTAVEILLRQIYIRGYIPLDNLNVKNDTTDIIQTNVSIDKEVKKRVRLILKGKGYTITEMVTAYMRRVIETRSIPFSLKQ